MFFRSKGRNRTLPVLNQSELNRQSASPPSLAADLDVSAGSEAFGVGALYLRRVWFDSSCWLWLLPPPPPPLGVRFRFGLHVLGLSFDTPTPPLLMRKMKEGQPGKSGRTPPPFDSSSLLSLALKQRALADFLLRLVKFDCKKLDVMVLQFYNFIFDVLCTFLYFFEFRCRSIHYKVQKSSFIH